MPKSIFVNMPVEGGDMGISVMPSAPSFVFISMADPEMTNNSNKRTNFLPHPSLRLIIQGQSKEWFPDLVNFVPAVAYLFCLALPTASTKPNVHLLAEPCIDSVHAGCQFLTDLCVEWSCHRGWLPCCAFGWSWFCLPTCRSPNIERHH